MKYLNLIEHIDELGRFMFNHYWRSDHNKGREISHGYSSKFINYDAWVDDKVYDLRDKVKDLDAIMDEQRDSWMKNPHMETWEKRNKYNFLVGAYFFKYHDKDIMDVKEQFVRFFPLYVRLKYGFSLDYNKKDEQ